MNHQPIKPDSEDKPPPSYTPHPALHSTFAYHPDTTPSEKIDRQLRAITSQIIANLTTMQVNLHNAEIGLHQAAKIIQTHAKAFREDEKENKMIISLIQKIMNAFISLQEEQTENKPIPYGMYT